MGSAPAPKPARDQSGIALFMVIASMSVLSLLVTEFTYIAQVSQTMAFDALDQVKAHYLAKSAFKLSLLRLKAYQHVKGMLSGGGAAVAATIPPSLLNQIWSMGIQYPFPKDIPGLSPADRDRIDKFQNASGLDGSFSSKIESESSKYNLNTILPGFRPSSSPSSSPDPNTNPNPNLNAGGGASSTYNAETARQSLLVYLQQIWQSKVESDPDFAALYRDLRLEDLADSMIAWADRTYERRSPNRADRIALKRAPYFSVNELRMLPGVDDEIFNLFGPAFTASTTSGINVNSIGEAALQGILPRITPEELKKFFTTRDAMAPEPDGTFKAADDFYKYLMNNVSYFRNSQQMVDQFKSDLAKRNIQIVTEENEFRVVVTATVNHSVRLIEAWVSLGTPSANKTAANGAANSNPNNSSGANGAPIGQPAPQQDAGLRITFMRIL